MPIHRGQFRSRREPIEMKAWYPVRKTVQRMVGVIPKGDHSVSDVVLSEWRAENLEKYS